MPLDSVLSEEVLSCSKRLEQIMSGELPELDGMDVMETLKQLPLTVEVLHRTRIGMTVNELRKKIKNRDVQAEAKHLIRSWKKLLDTKGGKAEANVGVDLKKNDSVSSNLSDLSRNSDVASPAAPPLPPSSSCVVERHSVQATSAFAPTGSQLRDSSREMIFKSLSMDTPLPGALDARQLANEVEECINSLHNDVQKYKTAIRSRVFNLRDKKNPELKENLLTGAVTPEQLARMTAEEMASDTMKELRKKFTKEAIDEHQLTQEQGTPTDMFKCGRCKKKNCTYTQAQTRSADEPMTTFVFCRECGNRWKFC